MYSLTDSNINYENSKNRGTTIYHLHTLQKKFRELDGFIHSYKSKLKRPEKSVDKILNNNKLNSLNTLPVLKTTISSNFSKKRNKVKSLHTEFLTTNAFQETNANTTFKFNISESTKLQTIDNFKKEKERLGKIKERMSKIREKKAKESKELKESNRLIKENILLLKDKMIEENKMKKRVVATSDKLRKHSLEAFQELKMKYVNELVTSDLMKGFKILTKKENEMKFLKMQLDSKEAKSKSKVQLK